MFIYSPYNSTVTNTSLLSTILVYGIYIASFTVVLGISIVIIHVTSQNSKLRTISNMLICNTCVISLFYSATTFLQIFMVVFNTHHKYSDSRTFCVIRAYLATVTSTLLSFSFLLQAVSRLFFTVFFNHRNLLLTFKFHYYLLVLQWAIGFLLPLSILIRSDHVLYRPVNFCTIDIRNTLHLAYLYSGAYLLPVVLIVLIYVRIVYRVNDSKNTASTRAKRNNSRSREARLLKNIIILVSIFTFGGLPSVIYVSVMAPRRILSIHFFIFSLLTIPLAIAMEKVAVLCLNSDIRTAFIKCCCCVVQKARKKRQQEQQRRQKKNNTALELDEQVEETKTHLRVICLNKETEVTVHYLVTLAQINDPVL